MWRVYGQSCSGVCKVRWTSPCQQWFREDCRSFWSQSAFINKQSFKRIGHVKNRFAWKLIKSSISHILRILVVIFCWITTDDGCDIVYRSWQQRRCSVAVKRLCEWGWDISQHGTHSFSLFLKKFAARQARGHTCSSFSTAVCFVRFGHSVATLLFLWAYGHYTGPEAGILASVKLGVLRYVTKSVICVLISSRLQ